MKQSPSENPKTVCAKCGGRGYWTYFQEPNSKVNCDCQKVESPSEEGKEIESKNSNAIRDSAIYKKVYSVIKQIPRKEVDGDSMDVSSAAYLICAELEKGDQEELLQEIINEITNNFNYANVVKSKFIITRRD